MFVVVCTHSDCTYGLSNFCWESCWLNLIDSVWKASPLLPKTVSGCWKMFRHHNRIKVFLSWRLSRALKDKFETSEKNCSSNSLFGFYTVIIFYPEIRREPQLHFSLTRWTWPSDLPSLSISLLIWKVVLITPTTYPQHWHENLMTNVKYGVCKIISATIVIITISISVYVYLKPISFLF